MRIPENSITRHQMLNLLTSAAIVALISEESRAQSGRKGLRMAVSTETLVGTNLNDAEAAYRVWINNLPPAERGSSMTEDISDVFIPSEQMIRECRQGKIDCFGGTALEFAKLIDVLDLTVLVLQSYLVDGMEYVLLVHTSSRFKKLSDLRGGQMLSHLHRDMVLLPAWLSTMLAADNLPTAEHFFGSLASHSKVNQVMLPVFFRSADGAFLARRSWETAVELNPQLGRDLRPLAFSPRVIPIVFAFSRNCNQENRRYLLESIERISAQINSNQLNALLESSGFVSRPGSAMKGTLEMVRQFERVSSRHAG